MSAWATRQFPVAAKTCRPGDLAEVDGYAAVPSGMPIRAVPDRGKRSWVKILVLALLLVPSWGTSAERLQVVFATGEWPPYSSQHLPDYGLATALVSAISREADIEPVYRFYPWKRAELLVLRGEVFAAFPYAISNERKADFDFSEVLFYGLNVLLYHQNNSRIADGFSYAVPADLRGYRIGGISGSFLRNDLDQAGVEYQETTSIDQSIQKLVAGRIDFVIDDKGVLADAVQRLYPQEVDNFKFVKEPFGEKKPTALIVSRDYPAAEQILARFNSALQTLRASGEYDRLLETYQMIK